MSYLRFIKKWHTNDTQHTHSPPPPPSLNEMTSYCSRYHTNNQPIIDRKGAHTHSLRDIASKLVRRLPAKKMDLTFLHACYLLQFSSNLCTSSRENVARILNYPNMKELVRFEISIGFQSNPQPIEDWISYLRCIFRQAFCPLAKFRRVPSNLIYFTSSKVVR